MLSCRNTIFFAWDAGLAQLNNIRERLDGIAVPVHWVVGIRVLGWVVDWVYWATKGVELVAGSTNWKETKIWVKFLGIKFLFNFALCFGCYSESFKANLWRKRFKSLKAYNAGGLNVGLVSTFCKLWTFISSIHPMLARENCLSSRGFVRGHFVLSLKVVSKS